MPKTRTIYVCSACGAESPKWMGKCPDCGAWNTYEEKAPEPADTPKKDDGTNPNRENSRQRFAKLLTAGENYNWQMNSEDIKNTLESVSANNYSADISDGTITAWSTVFEPDKRKAIYYFRGDYTKPFVIEF